MLDADAISWQINGEGEEAMDELEAGQGAFLLLCLGIGVPSYGPGRRVVPQLYPGNFAPLARFYATEPHV